MTMNPTNLFGGTRVESVFHPSDFTAASEVAFAHALKIALVTKATLHILRQARCPLANLPVGSALG